MLVATFNWAGGWWERPGHVCQSTCLLAMLKLESDLIAYLKPAWIWRLKPSNHGLVLGSVGRSVGWEMTLMVMWWHITMATQLYVRMLLGNKWTWMKNIDIYICILSDWKIERMHCEPTTLHCNVLTEQWHFAAFAPDHTLTATSHACACAYHSWIWRNRAVVADNRVIWTRTTFL